MYLERVSGGASSRSHFRFDDISRDNVAVVGLSLEAKHLDIDELQMKQNARQRRFNDLSNGEPERCLMP